MVKDTVRTRILVPGDKIPTEDFYAERKGQEARNPRNKTAFREAERKYKGSTPDLSEAYDFSNEDQLKPDVCLLRTWECSDGTKRPVYGIEGVEGFLYIPNAMTSKEKLYFIKQSFKKYPMKPNATNLDAHYKIPPEGLFSYFKEENDCKIYNKTKEIEEIITPSMLEDNFIRKTRWITLGYQYNWATKEYNFDETDLNSTFPEDLSIWTKQAVKKLGYDYISFKDSEVKLR